jgi:hypothetical protein
MEGRKEECNTFFYPLVSTDTGVGMLINFSMTSFALMHNKKTTIPYSFKVYFLAFICRYMDIFFTLCVY